MTSTIHAREGKRFKVTRVGLHVELSIWCDCVMAERAYHWHLLSKHHYVNEAEATIDQYVAGKNLIAP